MIVSKAAYAESRGVSPSAISQWIARGKLTGAALVDSRIDTDVADAQLASRVASVNRASAMARRLPSKRRAKSRAAPRKQRQTPSPARDPAQVAQEAAQARLLEARALSAMVDAERKRRELEAERGKYMLTADAEAALTKVMSTFLLEVEQSLPDLSITLVLDNAERIALRRWWRNRRVAVAQTMRQIAAAAPEFVEDTAA